MPNIEVVEKKSISMAVLKEDLAEIKKRDGELSFRGGKTEEYLNEFVTVKPKQAEELYNKIEKLGIPRLKDSHINKIIDLMPISIAELKVVMQGYALPVTNENLKKIIDIVAEFVPKKKEEKKEKEEKTESKKDSESSKAKPLNAKDESLSTSTQLKKKEEKE